MTKTKKKKPQSSNTNCRCKATFVKISTKKKLPKLTKTASKPKGCIAASKDAWQEYLALTPSFFMPSDPKGVFISGWNAGVEWAMRLIDGPNYKG